MLVVERACVLKIRKKSCSEYVYISNVKVVESTSGFVQVFSVSLDALREFQC